MKNNPIEEDTELENDPFAKIRHAVEGSSVALYEFKKVLDQINSIPNNPIEDDTKEITVGCSG